MLRLERCCGWLRRSGDDAGTSLVEMVVALAVFTVVMTLVFGMVINETNQSDAFKVRTQEQADTRLALDTLVRDLRQAYTCPSTPASIQTLLAPAKIRFCSPDRQPGDDFHLRSITYELTARRLTRLVQPSTNVYSQADGVGAAWSWPLSAPPAAVAVLTGVDSVVFTYSGQTIVIDLQVDQSSTSSAGPQKFHTVVNLGVTP